MTAACHPNRESDASCPDDHVSKAAAWTWRQQGSPLTIGNAEAEFPKREMQRIDEVNPDVQGSGAFCQGSSRFAPAF